MYFNHGNPTAEMNGMVCMLTGKTFFGIDDEFVWFEDLRLVPKSIRDEFIKQEGPAIERSLLVDKMIPQRPPEDHESFKEAIIKAKTREIYNAFRAL